MSREALHESLSAVMDNEADELELRRVLNAVDDAETRATSMAVEPCRSALRREDGVGGPAGFHSAVHGVTRSHHGTNNKTKTRDGGWRVGKRIREN